MDYTISPEKLKEAKDYLAKCPVDHKYDYLEDYLDGNMPLEQLFARSCTRLIKLAEEETQTHKE